jgi:serine/threonine-protein phosphatase 5
MSEIVNESSSSSESGETTKVYDEATIAAANALKDEGNTLLATGKFSHAAEKYSEAILLYPQSAIYYSNRAQALIKLENYGLAIQDANDALK